MLFSALWIASFLEYPLSPVLNHLAVHAHHHPFRFIMIACLIWSVNSWSVHAITFLPE